MSYSRINELLKGGSMIDYNLISDSLNEILVEMCTIIANQGDEIENLKVELSKKIKKDDLNEEFKNQEAIINEIKTGLQDTNAIFQEKYQNQTEAMRISGESTQAQIEDLKQVITKEMDAKFKEIHGEVFISAQQIKELNNQNVKQQGLIDKNITAIQKINDVLEQGKDKSIETIAASLNDLEKRFVDETEAEKKKNETINFNHEKLVKQFEKYKKDSTDEFHFLQVEVKEVRRLVVDAPSIDVDGVTDTEALVRAIQRDSRRIDNFNETIVAVKEEHSTLRCLFSELVRGFQKFQLNVVDFVENQNQVKKELAQRCEDNALKCDQIQKNTYVNAQNIYNVLDATLNSMNLISGTFAMMHGFLSKITSRPVPPLQSYDDTLLEFQRLSDIISSQNEHNDDLLKNEAKMARSQDNLRNFKFPYIAINDIPVDEKAQSTALMMATDDNEIADESRKKKQPVAHITPATSTAGGVDLELRHDFTEMKVKVESAITTIDNLKNTIDSKIERKADSVAIERMFDKVRVSISKLRDSINTTSRCVVDCIQRTEAETLIEQILEQMNTGGEASAGHNHMECLFCGRPRTTVSHNTGNLPKLTGTQMNAYDTIYGQPPTTSQTAQRRTPASTRPQREAGTEALDNSSSLRIQSSMSNRRPSPQFAKMRSPLPKSPK